MADLSPLVSVSETDLTTSVAAVATNIGVAILRNTYKGDEKKQVLVTDTDELISKFGYPTSVAACYEDILSTAAFLKNADKVYCTRVMPTSASFGGLKVPSGTAITATQFTTANALILSDIFNEDPDEFGSYIVSDNFPWWFIAKSRGLHGNNIRLAIADKTFHDLIVQRDAAVTGLTTYESLASIDGRLEDETEFLIVVEAKAQGSSTWKQVEYFFVSAEESHYDDEGRSMFIETVINQQSDYIRVSMSSAYLDTIFRCYTSEYQQFGGGQDSNNDSVTDADIMNALDLYENDEEIDINIIIDSDKSETVKQYAASICDTRLDCMAVIDPIYSLVVNNKGNETDDLINWRRGLTAQFAVNNLNITTSYAALYGNWGEVYDKWNEKYRWIPLSGHVAGAFSYTDNIAETWYAPAGLNRGILANVRRLAWNPNKAKRDLLYKNGINPICSFASAGKVIWGQKTLLDKNSAFNRINIRRLFIVLEKSLATSSKYYLFQQNTPFTRLALRNDIEPFLKEVQTNEGIYDYLVICDETNNYGDRIDNEELWCDIYIKPTRAAEFIYLNFIGTKTSASFTEIAALRAA